MNGTGNPSAKAVIKIFLSLGFDNELVNYMKDYHPEIAAIMDMKNSHNEEFSFVNEQDSLYHHYGLYDLWNNRGRSK